jgi:DNA-binding response OmpR family regulator
MHSVLIVEDEPEVGRLLVEELSDAGFQTLLAANGNQALELVAEKRPDLIILDWMLPGLDGLQVLRRLRAMLTSDVPVLMLSGRGDEMDRVLGLEVGADDYLAKPFSINELMARVRAMLRRGERIHAAASPVGTPSPLLRYGEIVLDITHHTAHIQDKDLELTRNEFALLSFLMRNPGRTFSRSDLQESIWHQYYVNGDRTVDNVVLRLRRKLGVYRDHLETVWGIGYRLRTL